MVNSVSKDHRFKSFIDNVGGVLDPYNLMLCPVIVPSPQLEGDAGATASEKSFKVLGIMQFVNKLNRAHITEEDIVSYI